MTCRKSPAGNSNPNGTGFAASPSVPEKRSSCAPNRESRLGATSRKWQRCCAGLEPSRFVLDGELAIPVGETFSFDALQMRLHPAESRIKKLAAETPAVLFLFDLLATPDGESSFANAAAAAPCGP